MSSPFSSFLTLNTTYYYYWVGTYEPRSIHDFCLNKNLMYIFCLFLSSLNTTPEFLVWCDHPIFLFLCGNRAVVSSVYFPVWQTWTFGSYSVSRKKIFSWLEQQEPNNLCRPCTHKKIFCTFAISFYFYFIQQRFLFVKWSYVHRENKWLCILFLLVCSRERG